MKRCEIYALFTAKVKSYMDAGYYINCETMSGTQGEIARVDLRKGDDVIRIFMEDHYSGHDHLDIIVGRCVQKLSGRHDTIWNNRLEIIEKMTFYTVSSALLWDCEWFIQNVDEAKENLKKHYRRRVMREVENVEWIAMRPNCVHLLNRIKQVPGHKRAKAEEIMVCVNKDLRPGDARFKRYNVKHNGKTVTLEA